MDQVIEHLLSKWKALTEFKHQYYQKKEKKSILVFSGA
jgi:hypothetical protein